MKNIIVTAPTFFMKRNGSEGGRSIWFCKKLERRDAYEGIRLKSQNKRRYRMCQKNLKIRQSVETDRKRYLL